MTTEYVGSAVRNLRANMLASLANAEEARGLLEARDDAAYAGLLRKRRLDPVHALPTALQQYFCSFVFICRRQLRYVHVFGLRLLRSTMATLN